MQQWSLIVHSLISNDCFSGSSKISELLKNKHVCTNAFILCKVTVKDPYGGT